MARIARVVVPGLPHHVTQRCTRREPVFFGPEGLSALPPSDRDGMVADEPHLLAAARYIARRSGGSRGW
jgi:hypothetical protein